MKKIIFFLIALFSLLSNGVLPAQSRILDLGIFKNLADPSKLEVYLRPIQDVENGAYSGGIFTVRFPSSYGVTLSAVPGSAQYSYTFAGPVGRSGGYDYYRYQFSGSVNMVNWKKGKAYPLLTLQVDGKMPLNAQFELVTKNDWTRANNADYYQELNGAEAERQFYTAPLKLITFDANLLADRSVRLDWTYETEAALSYSDIEYSTDGRRFGLLGQVPVHLGTDRVSSGYTYLHAQPQSSINYYRIRMVDIDGLVEYSPVRVINFDDPRADFNVFPNPTSGPLTLVSRNMAKYASGVRYQLIDNSGKVVSFDRVVDDNARLDLSKMPAGVYYLKIMSAEEQVARFQIVLTNN